MIQREGQGTRLVSSKLKWRRQGGQYTELPVNTIWKKIESWLSHNAPPVLRSLRGGATEQEIASVEAAIGHTFPSDYRESLLIHEGQELDQFGCSPGFVYGLNLYPLSKVLFGRKMINDLLRTGLGHDLVIKTHGAVRPVWLDRAWIPIADDGNNNHCCLDLNPAADGHVGQVIKVWNESHLRVVQSKSFHEWLAAFAELLEGGEYIYSEAHNGLISLDDAIADGVVKL